MRIHTLLSYCNPRIDPTGLPDIEVLGIEEDSRRVQKGDLFIARPGSKSDGAQFVNDAVARGAAAVVSQQKIDGLTVPQILVSDASLAASSIAHAYHGHPSRKLKVIGITGTNGKTTTTYLVRHLLKSVGRRCGLIGTVEIDDGFEPRESEMTTPGAVELAELMGAMRGNRCDACAIETSSHALSQNRVAAVEYSAAGFTNLTGDHLDYHKTMEAYADAKARLFGMLGESAVAAVNADDAWSAHMTRSCRAKLVRFGIKATDVDYRATDIAVTSAGTNFVLITPDGRAPVSMQLIGRHNIENALCAASILCELYGLSVHQIAAGMRGALGAPGRLEPVKAGQPFAVLVDYAHSDDALSNVLSALRPLTRGKLRVLFGCGGDRDRTKRPRMARTAINLADCVYITSDNPRTENPQSIIDEIVSGIPADTDKPVSVEVDRRKAIENILNDARQDDVVLLAGKGHENYQILGTTKHHFDDREEATRVLTGRGAVR